jgi:hypothetical protein
MYNSIPHPLTHRRLLTPERDMALQFLHREAINQMTQLNLTNLRPLAYYDPLGV